MGLRTNSLFGVLAMIMPAAAFAAPGADRTVDPAETRMPDLRPAEIDNQLQIGGEDIEGEKVRTRMTVAVMINDTGPYRFIVDSGADTSVVGERIAADLRLPAGDPALLNAMTESKYVERVSVAELTLGPTTVTDLELPVLREGDIGAEGMIGLDALVEQRLLLDFRDRTISVDDALSKPVRMDGEIVVTARLQRGQLILTKVKANGISLDAVVDTGTEISIGNDALRERLLRRNQKFETIEVTGVTGATANLQLAIVRELRLGPVILRNVPIAFAEVPPFAVFGLTDHPSLLLGTDLMETFRKVQLDFRARKVRFQLSRCTMVSRLISTSTWQATRIGADRSVPQVCED